MYSHLQKKTTLQKFKRTTAFTKVEQILHLQKRRDVNDRLTGTIGCKQLKPQASNASDLKMLMKK